MFSGDTERRKREEGKASNYSGDGTKEMEVEEEERGGGERKGG